MTGKWTLIRTPAEADVFYDSVVAYQTNNLHFGCKNFMKEGGPAAWSPHAKDKKKRTFFGFVRSGRWPVATITNIPDGPDRLVVVLELGTTHQYHSIVDQNLSGHKTFTSDGKEPVLRLRRATANEITNVVGAVRSNAAELEYDDPEFRAALKLG